MAIEPKGARKRVRGKAKKDEAALSPEVSENTEATEVAIAEPTEKKKSAKKAASIPVPMFQAAPDEVAPKKVKAAAASTPSESEETEEESFSSLDTSPSSNFLFRICLVSDTVSVSIFELIYMEFIYF